MVESALVFGMLHFLAMSDFPETPRPSLIAQWRSWYDYILRGAVKHIFFIAETKGTMDSLELKPIEQAKTRCAKNPSTGFLPLM